MTDSDTNFPDNSIAFYTLEVAPDGRRVVGKKEGAEFDAPNFLFDASGASLAELTIDGARSERHLFSADGRYLIGRMMRSPEPGTYEYFAAIWRTEDGALLGRTRVHKSEIEMRVSDDGRTLLAFAKEPFRPDRYQFAGDALYRLDSDGLRPIPLTFERTRGEQRALSAGAVSPDGHMLAAGHTDGSVVVWNDEGRVLAEFVGRDAPVVSIVVSPDNRYVAAADVSRTLWLYDLEAGAPVASPAFPADILEARFTPESNAIFVLTADGALSIVAVSLSGRPDDPMAVLDWVRAAQPDELSGVDRRRYGLLPTALLPAGEERTIAPVAIASPPERGERTGQTAACDALASSPFDRYGPAKGVAFEDLDTEAAVAACADALREAPDDAATLYHNGRIQDRRENYPEAMQFYRRAAELGYGAAMRSIARLIDIDEAGAFKDLGASSDWTERAALGGDRLALARMAVRHARSGDVDGALAYELAAGWDYIPGAALVVAEQLYGEADSDETRKLALFYGLLGEWRAVNVEGQGGVDDPSLVRERMAGPLRTLAYTLDPGDVVAIYRAARDWHPGVKPHW